MRKTLIVVALALVGGSGVVRAEDCPPGTTLQVIAQVVTANDTSGATVGFQDLTSTGHKVRATSVACGGTACVASLYDSDGVSSGVGDMGDSRVKAEPGAPANTSNYETYDPPLDFKEGIMVVDDGNVGGFFAYECRF